MSTARSYRFTLAALAVLVSLTALPAAAQNGPFCPIDENGRVADAFYGATSIQWKPVVEHVRMVLTVSTPCSTEIRDFERGEAVVFDIREVAGDLDGAYTWELRAVPEIDPEVAKALAAARESGDTKLQFELQQAGLLPSGPMVESGSFQVDRGTIIAPGEEEEGQGGKLTARVATSGPMSPAGGTAAGPRQVSAADQVIPDDLIVQGSLCVGFDCVNNESFGFDTIRMKENNTRIQFNDTSVGSFPTRNWQIRANSSASGGSSFLGFVDQNNSDTGETGDIVFHVQAGAPTNSLVVDAAGKIGIRKATPVLDLHISSSNTPAIRLEQTNAGGFTAQTWDIAGNEANFFVRDVTGGSTLPFRIQPGAPSNSINIDDDGFVGIGTTSANRPLHIIENAAPDNTLIEIQTNGPARMRMNNTANGEIWNFGHQSPAGSGLVFSDVGDAVSEMLLSVGGNLTIAGSLTTAGGNYPDYVFAEDYSLMSLAELAAFIGENGHLPGVPTADDVARHGGVNMSELQLALLEKVEELTLYTLGQEKVIADLEGVNMGQREEIADLQARLARIEEALAASRE